MLNTRPSTASLKQSESALGGLGHPSNSGRVNTATLNVAICRLPGPRTIAIPIPRSCSNADGQSGLASLDVYRYARNLWPVLPTSQASIQSEASGACGCSLQGRCSLSHMPNLAISIGLWHGGFHLQDHQIASWGPAMPDHKAAIYSRKREKGFSRKCGTFAVRIGDGK